MMAKMRCAEPETAMAMFCAVEEEEECMDFDIIESPPRAPAPPPQAASVFGAPAAYSASAARSGAGLFGAPAGTSLFGNSAVPPAAGKGGKGGGKGMGMGMGKGNIGGLFGASEAETTAILARREPEPWKPPEATKEYAEGQWFRGLGSNKRSGSTGGDSACL